MADTADDQKFQARLERVVSQMVAEGAPDEMIRGFIGEQKNEYRASRLAAAEEAGSIPALASQAIGDTAMSAKDRLVALARGAWTGAKTLAPEMVKPFGLPRMMMDPAKRRQIGRGASDAMTFGKGAPAVDALVENYPGLGVGGPTYAESEAADQAAAPGYREVGQGAAAINPLSPVAKAGQLAMKGVGSLGRLGPALQTRPAFQAAAVAPAMAAASGAAFGGAEGALQGAGDPLNAIPLLGLGTEKVLRLNPTINRYAQSMDNGQLAASRRLPGGAEGVQKASEVGLSRILKRSSELDDQESKQYQSATAPHLDKPIDVEPLQMKLLQGRQSNIDPDSGIPIRDDVDKAYNRAFDRTPEKATVRGTLMRRRGLQQEAGFGAANPTEAQQATREVYATFRDAVRAASPEVAAADDAYTSHARTASRRSDILYNTEENVIPSGNAHPEALPIDYADVPAPTETGRPRVGKERSAAATLKRIDDVNEPGLRAQRYLEELAGQDPAFAQALDFIAAKKADVGTRFRLQGMKPTNLAGATEFGGWGPTARQNARAVGANVGLPAARAAVSPGALNMNILVQLAKAEEEKKRRMAENLKRRGR